MPTIVGFTFHGADTGGDLLELDVWFKTAAEVTSDAEWSHVLLLPSAAAPMAALSQPKEEEGEKQVEKQELEEEELRVPARQLRALVTELLVAHGAAVGVAADVAEATVRCCCYCCCLYFYAVTDLCYRSQVCASERGVDSHGVKLLPRILERAAETNPVLCQLSTPARITMQAGPIATVDGNLSPGQHSTLVAARLAAALAQQHGIGFVAVKNGTHFGAAR